MYGLFEIDTDGRLVWMANAATPDELRETLAGWMAAGTPGDAMGHVIIKLEDFAQYDI